MFFTMESPTIRSEGGLRDGEVDGERCVPVCRGMVTGQLALGGTGAGGWSTSDMRGTGGGGRVAGD